VELAKRHVCAIYNKNKTQYSTAVYYTPLYPVTDFTALYKFILHYITLHVAITFECIAKVVVAAGAFYTMTPIGQQRQTEMHRTQGVCDEISSLAYHQSLHPVDQPNMTERTSIPRRLRVDMLEGGLFSIRGNWLPVIVNLSISDCLETGFTSADIVSHIIVSHSQ